MASLSKLKIPSILSQTLEDAFPSVSAGLKPFGSQVLVQVKTAATKTTGGLILTNDTIETEHDNTRIAKVIELGPVAYKNRETLAPWPEQDWCKPGDYVRIAQYGGDRWRVPLDGGGFAHFALIADLDIKGAIVGDPMQQLAWIG